MKSTNHKSPERGLTLKRLKQMNNKKTHIHTQKKNRQETWIGTSRDTEIANKDMYKCSNLLVISKIQMKTMQDINAHPSE